MGTGGGLIFALGCWFGGFGFLAAPDKMGSRGAADHVRLLAAAAGAGSAPGVRGSRPARTRSCPDTPSAGKPRPSKAGRKPITTEGRQHRRWVRSGEAYTFSTIRGRWSAKISCRSGRTGARPKGNSIEQKPGGPGPDSTIRSRPARIARRSPTAAFVQVARPLAGSTTKDTTRCRRLRWRYLIPTEFDL